MSDNDNNSEKKKSSLASKALDMVMPIRRFNPSRHKFVSGVATGVLVSALIAGGGYLAIKGAQRSLEERIANNPASQFIQSLGQFGEDVEEGYRALITDISESGFVQGTKKFVDETFVVPYNTITPNYQSTHVTIPITDVYVGTDTYMNLQIDQATNKLFGNLFPVIPETQLKYNGSEPIKLYEVDNSKKPAEIIEKELLPGDTISYKGVTVNVQPRLNIGQIEAERNVGVGADYRLELIITHEEGKTLPAPPKSLSPNNLTDLATYLEGLTAAGVDYQIVPRLEQVTLDTDIDLSFGVPPITVNKVPIASISQGKFPDLVDDLTQYWWIPGFGPGVVTLDYTLDFLANSEKITKGFEQVYLNFPRWTEEARKEPGNEDLPLAVLPVISEPTEEVYPLKKPEYFAPLWRDATIPAVTRIYMEQLKLLINVGVDSEKTCDSNLTGLSYMLSDGKDADFVKTANLDIGDTCKIVGDYDIMVGVEKPYIAPLQESVDDYLAEMRAKQKAEGKSYKGIDYNSISIIVGENPQ